MKLGMQIAAGAAAALTVAVAGVVLGTTERPPM